MDIAHFLLKKQYSARLVRRLKTTDRGILLDGRPAYTNERLSEGQVLTVTLLEDPPKEKIVPTPMELHICYEDRDILVIDKAAGVPVHPSMGNFSNTLINGLAFYLSEKGEPAACRIINRLDRDTTGLLIVARHSLSACILSQMVKDRQIRREYLAITSGKLPECGVIDAPIAREADSIITRCVDYEHGEAAKTHYRRLFYDPATDCSLAAVRLETGRTHQIRVHMKHIGHALPGDFLYNPDYRLIKRQALHSYRLHLPHPITGAPLHFEAALPRDMQFMGITSTAGLWDSDF